MIDSILFIKDKAKALMLKAKESTDPVTKTYFSNRADILFDVADELDFEFKKERNEI